MFKRWYQYPNAGVFLDFGSGCGKLCLAAALLHPFQKAGQKAKISSVMVQLCQSHGMDFLETNNCGDSIDFPLNGFELTWYIQNRSIPTLFRLLNVVTLRSSASKPCRASMTLKHKFRQSMLRLTSIS